MAAVIIGSNIQIPDQLSQTLSLYLLLAIGFKGGMILAFSPVSWVMFAALGIAMLMSCAVPLYSYQILRRIESPHDAAAIAATYGSVSAVTFVTAVSFLEALSVSYGGYMIAALAVMESPAIIMALILIGLATKTKQSIGETFLHSLKEKSHIILLGSLAIGLVSGLYMGNPELLMGFVKGDIFKGMLALFLLDMGVKVGTKIRDGRVKLTKKLIAFGLLSPIFNATVAIGLATLAGLLVGDAFLLGILAASASYIVVPAVLCYAMPEANYGKYFIMSLVVTFPLNILVGIPLYYNIAEFLIL